MSEPVQNANPAPSTSSENQKTVHILITQCLQNGFFLSDSNRLSLPESSIERMLIGSQADAQVQKIPKINRRKIDKAVSKAGPLYSFLKTTIAKPNRNVDLHVIHLKDWHTLSSRYDEERRLYGGHCEANTWEAQALEGYEEFLQPWQKKGASQDKQLADLNKAKSLTGYQDEKWSKVHFYEVLSDSVFDFKFSASFQHEAKLQERLNCERKKSKIHSHLSLLLDQLIKDDVQIYMVVIGVYTDVKMKTLLTGLRSRYDIPNLIVSDSLTTSPTLERHLQGLDFMDKVLNVEIVSDLNTLVSVLDVETNHEGRSSEESSIPSSLTDNSIRWRDYRNYFLDKQNVLAFQDERLGQYMRLTTERSLDVYQNTFQINSFLPILGLISIGLLLFLTGLDAFGIVKVSWQAFAALGISGVAQISSLFITEPQDRMRRNLGALVRLRNYLETYSMTSAILRHHLTTPENLQIHNQLKDLNDENSKLLTADELTDRLDLVEKQLGLVEKAADSLRKNFYDITAAKPEPEANPTTTTTTTTTNSAETSAG